MKILKYKLISDPEVLAVPIQENGDSLVDIREIPEILLDTRKSNASNSFFRLRESVIQKLLKARELLPAGTTFLIIEGHRPLSLQREYFERYSKELLSLHPDWDSVKIYQEASKYVAPPDIIPPHSTGGAVDLTLSDENGKEIDMGTRLNADPEESHNACFTDAENISDQAKANRKILIDAMTKAGFVNYPTEWWHWSYGDRYWAYLSKQPNAIFGAHE